MHAGARDEENYDGVAAVSKGEILTQVGLGWCLTKAGKRHI
jgi:hypothetical protein